jgi:hypothetical protein
MLGRAALAEDFAFRGHALALQDFAASAGGILAPLHGRNVEFDARIIGGIFRPELAGFVMAAGCLSGIPVLIVAYKKIYNKYRAE